MIVSKSVIRLSMISSSSLFVIKPVIVLNYVSDSLSINFKRLSSSNAVSKLLSAMLLFEFIFENCDLVTALNLTKQNNNVVLTNSLKRRSKKI